MDTSVEYKAVLEKQKLGAPVNVRDVAVAIANHDQTLLKFLADNDYKQVYRLLHESDNPMLIGVNAGFMPNKKRVEGELGLLIAKSDADTLNKILSEFVVNTNANNYTTDQQLLTSLREIEAIKSTSLGNQIAIRLR